MNRLKKFLRILTNFRFKLKGVNIEKGAFIHKSVDITNARNIRLGENSLLYKDISIYPKNKGSLTIGANSHIAPYGYLLIAEKKLVIGDDVAIGPFCTILCHSNNYEGESSLYRENYVSEDVVIGNNVFIGAQCTILPGSIIEDNVVIASNSVVKGRLNSGCIYGGTPVKMIKEVNQSE